MGTTSDNGIIIIKERMNKCPRSFGVIKLQMHLLSGFIYLFYSLTQAQE